MGKITKKGAKYRRVSTRHQHQDKHGNRIEDGSLEMQNSRIDRALDYKSLGDIQYEIITDIEDAGKSGKDTKRPGFQKLLRLIKNKEIDFIIASDHTRVSRSTVDFLNFVKLCADNSVEIILLNPEIDSTTPSGKLSLTILASLGEFEREQTSIRLKKNTKERLLSTGKINGADPLVGLVRCSERKGHFIIDEQGVSDAKKMFEIFLNSPTKTEALKEMKTIGIIDPRNNKPLNLARLETHIKNASWRYRGLWYLKDESGEVIETIKLDHGALLDNDLLDKVERKSQVMKKKYVRVVNGFNYLLSGILYYSDGTSFSGQISHGRNDDYRYYYNEGQKLRINMEKLESAVCDRVVEYFKKSKLLPSIIEKSLRAKDDKQPEVEKEIARLKIEHENLRQKEDSLMDSLTGEVPERVRERIFLAIDGIVTQLKEIENQLEYLTKTKEKASKMTSLKSIKANINTFTLKFHKLSRLQKRQLLEMIFERIVVHPDNKLELQIKKEASEWETSFNVRTNGSSTLNYGGTCWI